MCLSVLKFIFLYTVCSESSDSGIGGSGIGDSGIGGYGIGGSGIGGSGIGGSGIGGDEMQSMCVNIKFMTRASEVLNCISLDSNTNVR